MSGDEVDEAIRRAIGGDPGARSWLVARAGIDGHPLAQVMTCVLEGDPVRLADARCRAVSRRDRQVVEIARAHLAGDHDLVDALARDHLVDHPDSLIVAWIAAGAARPGPRDEDR